MGRGGSNVAVSFSSDVPWSQVGRAEYPADILQLSTLPFHSPFALLCELFVMPLLTFSSHPRQDTDAGDVTDALCRTTKPTWLTNLQHSGNLLSAGQGRTPPPGIN
jgi:hypothetical protein